MLDHRTHTFLATYRARSFTRAAEELRISQPAVSQHIHQLERHYGCALFAKRGRGIEPTPAGHLLYRSLCALENDERRMRAQAAALARRKDANPPLRFGCTRTVADFVAPQLISTHRSAHPRERISMACGNTSELVALIEQGELDFALVEGSFDREFFDSEVFSRERYVAVAAGSDQAARIGGSAGRPRSVTELLGRALILREPGSGTREILEKHLAARDLTTHDFADSVELASIPAIKACVQAGHGISFLYRIAVEQELASGALVDITPADFAIEHDFALIWQRGSHYADHYRALLAEWREHVEADADPGGTGVS